ncbi:hypothetical protein AWN90_16035 [Nocardia terpenica]|nr:hypothetical protein AWN90_16035 [Nocardia terpenica]
MYDDISTIQGNVQQIETALEDFKKYVEGWVTENWEGQASGEFTSFMGNWHNRTTDLNNTLHSTHVAVQQGVDETFANDASQAARYAM